MLEMNSSTTSSINLETNEEIRLNPGYVHLVSSKRSTLAKKNRGFQWPKYHLQMKPKPAGKTHPNPAAVKEPSDHSSLSHVSATTNDSHSSGIGASSNASSDEVNKVSDLTHRVVSKLSISIPPEPLHTVCITKMVVIMSRVATSNALRTTLQLSFSPLSWLSVIERATH